LAYGIYYDGGNNYTLSKNQEAITLICRALKENLKFLSKSEFRVTPSKLKIFMLIPTFLLSTMLSRVLNTKWAETVISNHALSARKEMEILTRDFIQLAENNGFELKYLKEMVNRAKIRK
jgi:2-dehydropantoate 2-reductase